MKETPFGKVPDDWEIDTLENICEVITDYVANGSFKSLADNVKYQDHEDSTVLIRLVDYNNGFNGEFVYVNDHAYEFLAKSKLFGNEIIISNVGANVGTVFRCPNLAKKMTLGPNSVMLKFKQDDDFYYYWLKSPYGQHMLKSIVTGSAQPKFNKTNLRQVVAPVPEECVQKKISSILLSLDKRIEINDKINRNLSEQAKTIFVEWFLDNPNASEWETGTFSDLVVSTLGGDWGKENETGNYTEQVYCVRGADIPEVNAGNKGKMPTRYILPKNYASKKLVDGDIVVEISGGSPTQSTGRVASISQSLLDRYDKGMVCTNFCRAIKPKPGYSMFIYYYWQYLYDKGVFFLYENGTTGIKNLDINGFLRSEEIVLPPKELVDRFDELCQSIFNQIFKNGMSTEKLAEIRDTLLPKLMSGELDVSNLDK